jgi:hypothetical protein
MKCLKFFSAIFGVACLAVPSSVRAVPDGSLTGLDKVPWASVPIAVQQVCSEVTLSGYLFTHG